MCVWADAGLRNLISFKGDNVEGWSSARECLCAAVKCIHASIFCPVSL